MTQSFFKMDTVGSQALQNEMRLTLSAQQL